MSDTYPSNHQCTNCGFACRVNNPKGKLVVQLSDCPNCGCLSLEQTFKQFSPSVITLQVQSIKGIQTICYNKHKKGDK